VTLNADLVRTRCGDIEDALQRLDRIRGMPRAEFLADRDVQDIAVRRLLVAIEAALGLCYHVSARRLQRVPDDFAACFAGLGQAGVINRRSVSGCRPGPASGTCSCTCTGRWITTACSTRWQRESRISAHSARQWRG
jgi:hypothetical protein